jgi:hypothetical protein
MDKPTCSFDLCNKTTHAGGLCPAHYQQRRAGQPLRPLRQPHPCAADGCDVTVWAQYCKLHGDRVSRLGTPHLPEPPTLQERFDDKVNKTATCWLWMGSTNHLEPVTHDVNMERAPYSAVQFQLAKTHCPTGHEYTPENTKLKRNASGGLSRECRTCIRRHHAEFRARRKQAATSSSRA